MDKLDKRTACQTSSTKLRKTLLGILGLLFSVVLTIPVVMALSVYREDKCIQQICRMGGTYTKGSARTPNPNSLILSRLTDQLFLNRVYKIDLSKDALDAFPADFRDGSGRISDGGLFHVAQLKHLQALDLEDATISDAGIVHLEKLSSLRILNVRGTQITDQGFSRLSYALPNCQIQFLEKAPQSAGASTASVPSSSTTKRDQDVMSP